MAPLTTTKMSPEGRIVIPREIREKLGLKSGSLFVVLGDKDTVILKTVTTPSEDQFDDLINRALFESKGLV